MIVFPYDVELPDGTTVTVESLADVRELIHACKEKRTHFPPCFHIVYPVTVVFPGGSELEVADREAFLKAVREWRSNNPDVEDRPTIKFPYEVMLRDGSTATVNNEEELKALIDLTFEEFTKEPAENAAAKSDKKADVKSETKAEEKAEE